MDNSIVREMGLLAEEVYENYQKDDEVKLYQNTVDEVTYRVKEVRDHSSGSGFQGMLLEKLDDKGQGTGNFVFAFRGTEFPGEFWDDLIISDIAYMGTSHAPEQMKDAMKFIHEMRDAFGLTSENTVFTGHSLGGSIAGMASYVYGFDAYTFNGFGIENMLWDADDTAAQNHPLEMKSGGQYQYPTDVYHSLGEYLENLNINVEKETNRITNIIHEGYDYDDVIGGFWTDVLSAQVGVTYFVSNHACNAGNIFDPYFNHKIAYLNQSIAIFNNLLTVFPAEDYNSLSAAIRLSRPEDKKVERLLNSLGELFGLPPNTDHLQLSESIAAQLGTVGSLSITPFVEFTDSPSLRASFCVNL